MNQLDFGNKKQTLLAIAILHSSKFRDSRSETLEGRRLYNKELKIAKRKVKQYHIELNEDLPREM